MPEQMKAPDKADDLALLKRAPAIAELQNISSRYGLNLTNDQANQIIDRAVERGKSDRGVKRSVRNQLFRVLVKTNPQKAIEVRLDQYKRRGYKIDKAVERKVRNITGREHSSERQARNRYLRANRILKESVQQRGERRAARKKAPAEQISPAQQKAVAKGFESMAQEKLDDFLITAKISSPRVHKVCEEVQGSASGKLELIDKSINLAIQNAKDPEAGPLGAALAGYAMSGRSPPPQIMLGMKIYQAALSDGMQDDKLVLGNLQSLRQQLKQDAKMIAQTRAALRQKGVSV